MTQDKLRFSDPVQTFTVQGSAGGQIGTPQPDGFYSDVTAAGAKGTWSNCDVHVNLPAAASVLQLRVYATSRGVTSLIFTGLVSSLALEAQSGRLVGLAASLRGHPSEEYIVTFRSPVTTLFTDLRLSLVCWGHESTPEAAGQRPGSGNMPDRPWPQRASANMALNEDNAWDPLRVNAAGELLVTGGGGGGGNVTIVSPVEPLIDDVEPNFETRVSASATLAMFAEGEPVGQQWKTARAGRPADDAVEPPAILQTQNYMMGYADSPEPFGQWYRVRCDTSGILRVVVEPHPSIPLNVTIVGTLPGSLAFSEDRAQASIPTSTTSFSLLYGFDRVADQARAVGARPLAAAVTQAIMNGADVPRALDTNAMSFFRELVAQAGGSVPGRAVAGISKTWGDWTGNERLAAGELVPAHQAMLKALSADATGQINLIAGQFNGTDRFRTLSVAPLVERVDTPTAPVVGTTACTPIVDARRNLKVVEDRGSATSGAFVQPLVGTPSTNVGSAVLRAAQTILRWVSAQLENTDAPAQVWFQLFNRTTAPGLGTAADYSFRLDMTLRTFSLEPIIGQYFSTGLVYGWSSTRDTYTAIDVAAVDARVEWLYAD